MPLYCELNLTHAFYQISVLFLFFRHMSKSILVKLPWLFTLQKIQQINQLMVSGMFPCLIPSETQYSGNPNPKCVWYSNYR